MNEGTIIPAPLVEMKGITKRFPGVLANDHIDFELASGEIHALLGENGAGKTTLMNILYGLYRPDEGEIWVRGSRALIRSPKDSIKLGIGMVHQHFALVPTISVAENVVLGLKSRREPLLELDEVSTRIHELSRAYGLEVDPKARIEQLSVGERQRVEIIKALYREARILILDEPTSVLTPQEADDLFKLLRSMTTEGRSVVFITHKLPEVMAVSSRVTVLRHGKVTARLKTTQTNPNELAEKMVGKELVAMSGDRVAGTSSEPLLVVENLSAMSDKGVVALRTVSFSVNRGEILGVAGVAGNGQRELAEVLAGMRKAIEGRILVSGEDMTNASPRKLIEHGVAQIPEDRLEAGLILDFSVAENLILEVRAQPPYAENGFLPFGWRLFLNEREIREHALKLVQEYDIDTPSVDTPARNLSGGNLQKLTLAKVFSRNPSLIVAVQPTAGLDVGSTQFIWSKLREQRGKGMALLLISGDLNEIISLSDRIAVIYGGRIAGILPASQAEVKKLGLMMGGVG